MGWTKRLGPFPIVGVLLFLLYCLTRVHAHSWDAIAYTARAVGDPLLSEVYLSTRRFHPHHLLYIPFGFLLQQVFRLLGLAAADPFLPMQFANSLLGAGCALLAGSLVQRFSGSARRGLFTAIAVGLAHAVWFYATEVEEIVPALFFVLLSVRLLVDTPSAGRWGAAGAALALATLLHQLVVPLGLGLVLAMLAARDNECRRRHAFLFAGVWIGATAVTYVIVAIASANVRSVAGFADWVLSARSRASFGHERSGASFYQAARAIAESLVATSPLSLVRMPAPGPAAILGRVGVAAVSFAVLSGFAALVLSAVRSLIRPPRYLPTVLLGLLLGTFLLALFILWFQPFNMDYWTYVVVLAWVMSAALAPIPAILRRDRRRRVACWAAAFYCLALGGINLPCHAVRLRDPETAVYRGVVEFARRQLRPGGSLLVVDEAFRPLETLLALPLFVRIPVVLLSADSLSADTQRARQEIARYRNSGNEIYATAAALARLGRREEAEALPRESFAGQSVFLLPPPSSPEPEHP